MDKVAVLGPAGTFSDMAARAAGFEPEYFKTHEDVFETVGKGPVRYGLVAVENQMSGTIVENLDMLMASGLLIQKEIVLPIHHYLCALVNHKKIITVYSHPQGFLQCKNFLKNRFKNISVKSTADAFRHVKENNLLDCACIGTKMASEIYGFEVVKANIEDYKHNQTRFFVISKDKGDKGNKTSIVFKVKHEPGSLVNSLQRLAKYDINLTKIESRPIPQSPWEYLFFCDLECTDVQKLDKAIREMGISLEFMKRLGTYDVMKVEE